MRALGIIVAALLCWPGFAVGQGPRKWIIVDTVEIPVDTFWRVDTLRRVDTVTLVHVDTVPRVCPICPAPTDTVVPPPPPPPPADTTSPPSALYPHRPSSYVRFAEHSFAGIPSSGATAIAGAWWNTTSAYLSGASTTGPTSPTGVFEFVFPAGQTVGSSRGMLNGWGESTTSPEMREFYESGWFKIPSSSFETPGPGMKLLGYWAVGQKYTSKPPNQIYFQIRGNGVGTSIMSSWAFDIRQQNNVNRNMTANRSTKRIVAGRWHRYEMQMVLNAVDQPNGVLRFWLDNGDGNGLQLTHEYTDVKWRTSAANSADGIDAQGGFYQRRWDPIWGGMGGDAKTRRDSLWIDHLYLAGVRK